MSVVSPAERRKRIAAMFDSVVDVYDNVGVPWFTPIARRLVHEVNPARGDRALDLGCGRGAALFALADRVGPAGRVTGIDLSPRMVRATRESVPGSKRSYVEVAVDDAGQPSLPACTYDVAVASFVLFFLPAPIAALRAWHELLVPGGRLGISTFTDSSVGWLEDLFASFLPAPVFAERAAGGSRAFDSDQGVERLVEAGGFVDVRTTAFELEVAFGDGDQWYDWSRSHGQRAIWDRLSAADTARVRAAAAERLERSRTPDGQIRMTQRIRMTLARRAG